MSVSFIHRGTPSMASYRYRAAIPAAELGAAINDHKADVLVFSKPTHEDCLNAQAAQASGRIVVADFCDDHFDRYEHYVQLASIADAVTCPTETMAHRIRGFMGRDATVIADPYEFPEAVPHCRGNRCLWFGHAVNFHSLERVLPDVRAPLTIVSNAAGMRPWSMETMYREFAHADIVLLPATAPYKSANRAVESIRQGCFVVAEPHPALDGFPGIWVGNIKEGIEWAQENHWIANERTTQAQQFIKQRFSPKTQASAWKSLFEKVRSRSTSAAGKSTGQAGSASIATAAP